MRKLATVLLSATALLGGAYSYCWFHQSDNLKTNIEQTVRHFNDQSRALNNNQDIIRYESLNVSGFPFSMRADFSKLSLTIPLSAVVAQMDAEKAKIPAQDTVLEMAYQGKVSLESNMMADRFSFIITGEQSIRPTVAGTAYPALVSTSDAPLACHLQIANPDNMPWNFPRVFADAPSFLAAFRQLECEGSGMTTRYGDSPDTISSADRLLTRLELLPEAQNRRKASVKLELDNVMSNAVYDQVANSWLQMIYEALRMPQKERGYVIETAQYGAQTMKIDLAYEGPVELKYLTDPALKATLDVNAFDIKNDLYASQNEAHLQLLPAAENQVNTAVSWHGVSEYTEKASRRQYER